MKAYLLDRDQNCLQAELVKGVVRQARLMRGSEFVVLHIVDDRRTEDKYFAERSLLQGVNHRSLKVCTVIFGRVIRSIRDDHLILVRWEEILHVLDGKLAGRTFQSHGLKP